MCVCACTCLCIVGTGLWFGFNFSNDIIVLMMNVHLRIHAFRSSFFFLLNYESLEFLRPTNASAASPFRHASVRLQVAIIAGNFDLAETIKIHKSSDVGEFVRVARARDP